MKKLLLTTAISTSLILSPMAQAQEQKKLTDANEEEISFGVGAIIGGILGGPAGAMITGLAGTFLMKHVNSEDKLEALSKDYDVQSAEFEQQIAHLKSQMQQAEFQYQQELVAFEQVQNQASKLQASNLMMSLQFRTGSSDIPEYYQEQVQALATILSNNDSLTIDLSGYTDLLGDSQLNLALSKARAESVKRALVELGVEETRINTFAFGDQQPVVANAQNKSSFYDRRVMINLSAVSEQVAKN